MTVITTATMTLLWYSNSYENGSDARQRKNRKHYSHHLRINTHLKTSIRSEKAKFLYPSFLYRFFSHHALVCSGPNKQLCFTVQRPVLQHK